MKWWCDVEYLESMLARLEDENAKIALYEIRPLLIIIIKKILEDIQE